MAQQKQNTLTKGKLGRLKGNTSNDLTFQFNPTTIRRTRRATYANNNAALADFPNNESDVPAIEWIRNEAEEFSVDLLFHVDGDKDVETQLKRLDEFMEPEAISGEPMDLILMWGPRSDLVRILEKDVVEKLFTSDLHVQEATVTLKLKALRSRRAGSRF